MEEMWLARDECGELYLYSQKPRKNNVRWGVRQGMRIGQLPAFMFPEVKWSDEDPTKVKLVIEK